MRFSPITPSDGLSLGAGWEGRGRLGREMEDQLVDCGSDVEISTRALPSSEESEDGGMGRAEFWVTVL